MNAAVHLLSYREDAAQELLRALKRGFEGLPAFLRLPAERETSTVLAYAAGGHDRRSLKVFPGHAERGDRGDDVAPRARRVGAHLRPRGGLDCGRADTARSCDLGPDHDRSHPGDFVHEYWRRSLDGQTRHTPVFVSALERSDRSPAWLEQKRREEGKSRSLRNYPLTAEEAFAAAGEPYFDPALLEEAQRDAMAPSRVRPGDRYVKAWDIGRKDATVCVVLRAPRADEAQVWDVVDYTRLVDQDFPAIQSQIEAKHRDLSRAHGHRGQLDRPAHDPEPEPRRATR